MTGMERQSQRLTEKRIALVEVYKATPMIYPDTRQIRRQERRAADKERLLFMLKAARKLKRNKKREEHFSLPKIPEEKEQ